jgi:hypothetical protein
LNQSPIHSPFEFKGDAAVVGAKGHDVQALDGARQVQRRAALPEGGNFIDTGQLLRCAKSDGKRTSPKPSHESLAIVAHQRGFVPRIQLCQFSNDLGSLIRMD